MNPMAETRCGEAKCGSILADGSMVTVTATRRARAGRADVKCQVPGAPALAERMQQVVRLARHTEACYDSRDQVVLSLDRAPAPCERDWELAAVLADRMVRGLYRPRGPVVANGWSDAWQLGRVQGHSLRTVPAGVLVGGGAGLPHLGLLSGRSDPSAAVSSARAWFPLLSGGLHDSLCWVEVSVYPMARGEDEGGDDANPIAVAGLDAARQCAVREVLAGARHFDACRSGRWRTVVRFGQERFQGDSYELALVMADRLARGREFAARGRIIASGRSGAWHAGRVETVEGMEAKCALLAREAGAGDRVLLPGAWEASLPPDFAPALRASGASLACVERIGII